MRIACRNCEEGQLDPKVTVAAHDAGQLDVLLVCDECEFTLNGFLAVEDMMEVEITV